MGAPQDSASCPHTSRKAPLSDAPIAFPRSAEQLMRTETLFGQAVWENVSPLNFMTGSNSFGGRTNEGLFLNTRCVIVTNNRKLMARYVVGQKAVPLGQAAGCPHHGHILRAGCRCWLCSGDCQKHRTPLKGPATDTREEGRHNPEPKPSHAPRPTRAVSHSCGATEVLWVCFIYHGHQRHFQNEVCHLPCLGDRQRDSSLPYWVPGCHVPATGRKAASGKCKTFLFEKQS